MTTTQFSGTAPSALGHPARQQARIRELERSLERLELERQEQALAVEQELDRLGRIYSRTRDDLDLVKAERDQAREAAREERAARAREALDLARKLEEAEQAFLRGPGMLDRFVQERLAQAPEEELPLPEDGPPELEGYRVFEKLGEGGMATVYRAIRRSDGREVAIKLLHDTSRKSQARTELFLREVAVMLQLDHPALVRALDAGESPYGRFLVLEFIDGEPLNYLVRREGPLREDAAIEVALEVANALRYCRRARLFHRDIKPGNLLRERSGGIKLCDFGLAAVAGDSGSKAYGSPGYAAPEQLVPGADVDERADIYGLGCTLWHLVVGHRAFSGPPKEVFSDQRVRGLPDPRFEGADISSAFAKVVRRMGRVSPADRYRSWDELILDLTLIQHGSPAFAAELSDALRPSPSTEPESPPDWQDAPSAPTHVDGADTPEWEDTPSVATIPGDCPEPVRAPTESVSDVEPDDPPRPAPAEPAPTQTVSAPAPPAPRSGRWLFVAACLVAGLAGALIENRLTPDPVDVLIRNARHRAAQGEPAAAAAELRSAARLLAPDAAERALEAADAIGD